MKKVIGSFVVILCLVLIYVGYKSSVRFSRDTVVPAQSSSERVGEVEYQEFDAKNTSFFIDGRSVTLSNGVSKQVTAPDSVSETIVRYFGNEAMGDLNGDGKDDIVFLVTEETGGSGTFYYAVAAVTAMEGYRVTNAVFVGDRIAPQSTYIPEGSGAVQVNYAKRRVGEPMTAAPSEGATLMLHVTSENVLEAVLPQ